IISSKQPGTLYWYYDQILKFQAKRDSSDVLIVDPLEVNELGIIQYAEEDIERRLISHASIIEVDDELIIKVAKKDGDNLARLNPIDEIPAFKDYIKNIKYPGTKTRIVSTEPDLVDLQISIYFDNVFQKETVQQNVHNKMNEYRSELGFNGVIIKQRLMDKILDAEGVVSLKVNSMQASYFHPDKNQYTENQTIDVAYKLYSGYFNYKTEINIDSFIDFSTI
ncbi:MAG: hypothetical protein MI922_24045, partial [Bacteroidales bacterium]|nr:hypothetical protein [Bacteroidales bacterium]